MSGSATLKITLDVQTGTSGQTLYNLAEIASDGEPAGSDVDSTPDANNSETPVKDDVTDEDAKTNPGVADEDDHDIAQIKVEQRVAIGNIVFLDGNNNGRFEPGLGETGVNGVTVALFAQGQDASLDQPLATVVTANGGVYLFDLLAPGRYFVHIAPSQFQPGKPLERLSSSTGAGGDTGMDDNGDENGGDGGDPMTRGVSSGIIDLQPGTEPMLESGQGTYGGVLPDASANMTVDFGFHSRRP